MKRIAIQRGHYGLVTGGTGAPGEQEFNSMLALALKDLLEQYDIRVTLFDAKVPATDETFDAFVAIHADAANNPKAHGFSIGFPDFDGDDGALARLLKDSYEKATGLTYRGFNITPGEHRYYAFKKIRARGRVLLEAGFISNPAERAWLEKNIPLIAWVIADVLLRFLNAQAYAGAVEVRLDNALLIARNDEEHAFLDDSGRTLASLRKLAEKLGLQVLWDGERKTVTLLTPNAHNDTQTKEGDGAA